MAGYAALRALRGISVEAGAATSLHCHVAGAEGVTGLILKNSNALSHPTGTHQQAASSSGR